MASFTKELSDVDVTKNMAVPTHFIRHLPSHGDGGVTQYVPVVDKSGKVWRFGYYIRGENSRYPKPVFQGEWHQFVSEKNLVAGDKIIFRMEVDADGVPRYRIAAEKRIQLFGTVVWGDID